MTDPQPRMYSLSVRGMPPSLNAHYGWRTRYTISKRFIEDVMWQCKAFYLREPLQHAKVTYTFVYTNGRFRDWDNAVAATKCLTDALVYAKVLVDDSPEHVEIVITQERGGSRCVRLVVEEVV